MAAKGAAARVLQPEPDDQLTAEEEAQLMGREPDEGAEEAEGAEAPPPQPQPMSEDRFAQLLAHNQRMQADLDEVRGFVREFRTGNQRAQEAITQAEQRRTRPDPTTDPFGAVTWDFKDEIRQLRAQLEPLQQQLGQVQQTSTVQRQAMEMQQWANADVNAARQRYEDYDAVSTQLTQALVELGVASGMTPQQAHEFFNSVVIWPFAQSCREHGRSLADNFYRFGRQLLALAPAQPQQQLQRSPLAQVQSEVARLRTGQQLRGVSGGQSLKQTRLGVLPADQFDQMSDDTAARLYADPRARLAYERNFRRLEGVETEPEWVQ